MSLDNFCWPGQADCTLGGQWGSEGKGAAVAWLVHQLDRANRRYDIVTTNASSQAGHTAVHNGETFVTRHLPTAPLIVPGSTVFLNAGCAIDPDVFEQELKDLDYLARCSGFYIHPNAAVITPDCIAAENRPDSAQTKIASTRKGVGEAIARKVLRSGLIARDHLLLKRFVRPARTFDITGQRVLVEIPQGFGLSLNGEFYPACTSRDCTIMQALSDARIHPHRLGSVLMVLRTFPIRVGNIEGGNSGGCYPDQKETTWQEIGQTPEITTVTKRQRRLFTWSQQQVNEAVAVNMPNAVFLSHADYVQDRDLGPFILSILIAAHTAAIPRPAIYYSNGPTTDHVQAWTDIGGQQDDRERERQLFG